MVVCAGPEGWGVGEKGLGRTQGHGDGRATRDIWERLTFSLNPILASFIRCFLSHSSTAKVVTH